jgi:formylglycine-generating enzyme required for sulfatase activity
MAVFPRWLLASAWLLAMGTACSPPARPQLVVFLDTDAPVVGQLACATGDAAACATSISPDAAIDTVRIDVLDEADNVLAIQTFVASDVSSWPLSFGVAPGASGEIRLRIRLFRAVFASPGTTAGVATLDPPPEVTIERLVHIPAPTAGIEQVSLFLTEDCLDAPSTFAAPESTCIDANEMSGDPGDGILPGGTTATRIGTWPPAQEVPCTLSHSGAVCIPGGFSILGELSLSGSSDQTGYDPVPLRPVIVSPFLLDTNEFSVGRFRTLVTSGKFTGALPTTGTGFSGPDANFCSWLGETVADDDDDPLNCITWEAAALACKLEGGALPSEAEWEHAARGRGRRFLHPWGDEDASCCSSGLSRSTGDMMFFAECPAPPILPVGSYPPAKCDGIGDVSLDGVVDMQGSVREAVADDLDTYDAPCWSTTGVPTDPVCNDPSAVGHAERGESWEDPLSSEVPSRWLWTDNGEGDGVRCAYPGASP